jgi:uncharacterized protein
LRLWINMDWGWATVGTAGGFDPSVFPRGWVRTTMIGFRMAGAVVVVPVMEELFWRSFVARWLVDPDFAKDPVGAFTPVYWPEMCESWRTGFRRR